MPGVLIFAIHNLISLSLIWFTVNRCLEPKYSRRKTVLVEAISLALVLVFGRCCELYPVLEPFRPVAFLTLLFSLTVILFQNKLFRKLLVMLCAYLTVIAAEVILMLVLPEQSFALIGYEYSIINFWWNFMYLGCEGILLFCVYLFFRNSASEDVDQIPLGQYWFFLFFPISQLALFSAIVFSLPDTASLATALILIVSSLICIVADVVWFRELRRLGDHARLKAENDLLNQQVQAQRSYYTTLSENYAHMARMRHDISNHIFTIRALLKDGKSKQAMEYASQLEQSPAAQSILSACKNSVVHSFLQHRWKELEEKNVTSDFDVSLPPVTGIPDTDLIIALGNMLDNATEACLASQRREVRLSVGERDGFIRIETENTCSAGKPPRKKRIAYLERGIGTSILQSLAKEYQGSYISARDGERNHAVLVLKGKAVR